MIDPPLGKHHPGNNPFSIPFTQYLLPDGRVRPERFDVVGHTAVAAKAMVSHGLRFEAEILTTGQARSR